MRPQDTTKKASGPNQCTAQLERTMSSAESLYQQSFVSGGTWETAPSTVFCEEPEPMNMKNDTGGLNEHEPIIAIMGPTGAGKSTFMNIVAGSDVAQIGEDLASCTHDIQVVRCHNPSRKSGVSFVDTPGFDDTYRSDKDILEELAEWLEKTYRQGIQLSGILFLHRITDNRMSNTLLRNLDLFRKLCGDDTLSNIRLVTTHWDLLPTMKEGERIEKELCEEYWAPFIASGARVHRFQNSPASAWEIINSLPMERKSMQIQKELVDMGIPLLLTSAGYALYSTTSKVIGDLIAWLETLVKKVVSPVSPKSSYSEKPPNEKTPKGAKKDSRRSGSLPKSPPAKSRKLSSPSVPLDAFASYRHEEDEQKLREAREELRRSEKSRRPPRRSSSLHHRRPRPDAVFSCDDMITPSRPHIESPFKLRRRLTQLQRSLRRAPADLHFESVKHPYSSIDTEDSFYDMPGTLPPTRVPSRAGSATTSLLTLCGDDAY